MALSIGRIFGLLELQDNFTSRIVTAGQTLDAFASKLGAMNVNKLAQQLDSVGTAATKAGTTLSVGLTLPIVGVAAAALRSGEQFEGAMNRVQAALDAPEEQMNALRAAAQKMGADTVFSSTEAANAMVELGKAGFTANEAIDALPSTLQLAIAGQMELADAATLTSNTMKTFGLSVADLGHANDVLAKAANSSTINVSDLAEGFKYVGPVANAAGVSLETVSAAMALLGEAGIKGSMAGTTLRNVMTSLMSPTEKQARLMKELGLESAFSNGKLMPMADILKILEGQTNKTAEIMELFGDRAGPGMVAMVEKGSGALTKLDRALQDSDGYAQRAADTMMKGLPGAMERMRGSIDTAFTALNKSLTPAFIALANAASSAADFITNKVLPAFDKLPEPVKIGTIALAAMIALIGPLLLALGGIATGIATLLPGFALMNTAVFTLGNTVPILTARLWLMNTAGAAIAGSAGTLGLIVIALGGIVYGIMRVIDAWGKFQNALSQGKGWEFLTAHDDNTWIRRKLGLNVNSAGVPELPKAPGADKQKAPGGLPADWMTNPNAGVGGMAAATVAAKTYGDEVADAEKKIKGLSAAHRNDLARALRDGIKSTADLNAQFKIGEFAIDLYKKRIETGSKATEQAGKVAQETAELTEKFVRTLNVAQFEHELYNQSVRAGLRLGQEQIPTIDTTRDSFDRLTDITKKLGSATFFSAAETRKFEMEQERIARTLAIAEQAIENERLAFSDLANGLINFSRVIPGAMGKGIEEIGHMIGSFNDLKKATEDLRKNAARSWGMMAENALNWGTSVIGVVKTVADFLDRDTLTAKMVRDFEAAQGGVNKLRLAAKMAGVDYDQMKRLANGSAEAFKRMTDRLEAQMDAHNELMDRYGLTWKDFGERLRQANVTEMARQLIDDWKTLKAQGVDTTKAMAGGLSDLVLAAIQTGTKIPKALQPMLDTLIRSGKLSEAAAKALLGMADDGVPSLDDITAAAERYGLKLDDLGSKVQQLRIDEMASQLTADWDILIRAGADANVVMGGMQKNVQDIITKALVMGLAVPDSMRPIIQKMIDAGLLTDEFGEKLGDTSRINFTTPLAQRIDDLIAKLGELIDKLNNVGSTAEGALGRVRNLREYGEATGTAVPRGSVEPDTPAGTREMSNDPSSGGSARAPRTMTTNVILDGRRIGRAVTPVVYEELDLHGVVSR